MTNSPVKLSASQASLVLQRASKIDARGDSLSIGELRKIAAEAGIDEGATNTAIAGILADEEPARMPAVSEVSKDPGTTSNLPSPTQTLPGEPVRVALAFLAWVTIGQPQVVWPIPQTSGQDISISLGLGDQLFIVGVNGSGKSALIQHLAAAGGTRAKIRRISAHRQTWLNSGAISLTPLNRKEYDQSIRQHEMRPDARWMDHNAAPKQSAVLFDLVAEDNDRARVIARQVDNGDPQEASLVASRIPPPFEKLNELLALGTLTVSLENSKGEEILARHQDSDTKFSIAKMSDGERSAVILAANVLTAEAGTVFLIDEPERHLHRAIIEPFLSALFMQRKDCIFVVATHEIALPVASPKSRALIVRSCEWNGDLGGRWDVQSLSPNVGLPEDLRRAILGSRRRVLFVEGDTTSLDQPLYDALFPGLSVVPTGSASDVQRAVTGIRQTVELHHAEAFGIVDRDNRPSDEIARLELAGVLVLEPWSVEGLYYCSDALAAVARRQAESLGCDPDEMIASATQRALAELRQTDIARRMAARRCERQVRNQIVSAIPGWKAIMSNPATDFCSSVKSPYPEELRRFQELVAQRDLDRLVCAYPLRESNVFQTIAVTLKCPKKRDYHQMVVARVHKDVDLAKTLRTRITGLSRVLAS